MNRHRFANAKPTKLGRIGHPEGGHGVQGGMFKCGGVIFTDRHTNTRWTLRVFLPTPHTGQVTVWTYALWREAGRYSKGFAPQEVMPEAKVPDDVSTFAWAELTRLRLTGRIPA